MNPSTYSPLCYSSREIRLVTIHPSSEKSAPIICTTIKVSLDRAPSYHALSYCWGDPSIAIPISLNRAEAQVTANLDVALRHFRAAQRALRGKNQQVHWWIDAICINQADLDERSQQVQLMRDIYSEASCVVVWLGEEGEDGRLALEVIQGLYRQFGDKQNEVSREETLKELNELDGSPQSNAILSFFERPWWTRLWTVQEYVFGKKVTFICGDISFSWDLLHWWSLIITAKTDPASWKFQKYSFLKLIWGRGCAGLFAKSFLRAEHLAQKKITRNLSYILGGLLDCMMCTDPRDRIYAVQGLANDGDSFGPPDYTISISALYTKIAGIMAETHQNLEILHNSPPRSSTAPDGVVLPSWVPDWGQVGYPRPLNAERYNASLGRKAQVHYFPLPSPALIVQGVIWDTVIGIDTFPVTYFLSNEHRSRAVSAENRRNELLDQYDNVTTLSNDGLSRKPRVIWCDNCCGPVLDQHYHCNICGNGDFNLCFGCVEDGIWCGGDNHELIKRHIIENEICSSDAGTLSPGTMQEKSKILAEDTPGWARLIYEGRSQIYPTGIPQLQAYFRTILFDRDYVTDARLSSSEDRFFEFVKLFMLGAMFRPWYPPCSEIARWKRHALRYSEAPLQFDIFLGDPGSEGALTWPSNTSISTIVKAYSSLNARPFVSTLEHKTRGRKFFVTGRGYMGLGPPRVEVGDVVCVLPGLSVPVIMRKTDGHYTHQGECFVLGIMEGEVMENLEKATVSLEELEIH